MSTPTTTDEPRDDGGPAFPRVPNEMFDGVPGMSLRDYFAAQVIAQCQITVNREEPPPDADVVAAYAARYARTAYVIADAMIAARKAPR